MAQCNITREVCYEDMLAYDNVAAMNQFVYDVHGIGKYPYFIFNGEVFMTTPPGLFHKDLSYTGFSEWDLIGSEEITSDIFEFEPVVYPTEGDVLGEDGDIL